MLPEHYIQLADELLESDLKTNRITIYKTAMENYYHGAFLLCKEILIKAIHPIKSKNLLNNNAHFLVKKSFSRSNTLYPVGSILEELKLYKDEIDYNPAFTPTKYDVKLAKIYAKEIFSFLEDVKKEDLENLKDIFTELNKQL